MFRALTKNDANIYLISIFSIKEVTELIDLYQLFWRKQNPKIN